MPMKPHNNQRYSTESFIAKAREVHGDRYDYSLVDYKTNKIPVTIICPIHGAFTQIPSGHLSGRGCRKCGRIDSSSKQKKSTDQFLEQARSVHGDRYDYSRVDYRGNKSKVQIICPAHGVFEQTPDNHLAGKGCSRCAKDDLSDNLRKSPAQFTKQARLIHGDKYEYAKAAYHQARAKVEIVCRKHGAFWQTPDSHLRGQGCPKCRDEATSDRFRMSTAEFIDRASRLHHDKFDYSRVKYETAWLPVEILCPIHGSFRQAPVTHLNSVHGCPKCAHGMLNRDRRLTTDEFLERARAIHGDKYDYGETVCLDSKTYVTLICPKHGAFKQTAGEHLAGKGCKKCGNELAAAKQTMSQDEFLARAREAHGDKYDYSLVEYKSAKGKVKIICPVHGEFEQSAFAHFTKGCRKCADEALPGRYTLKILRRDKVLAARPAILYYLHFLSDSESFYKVGITLTSVRNRFAGYQQSGYNYTILQQKKTTLIDAYTREQEILLHHGKVFAHRPTLWQGDSNWGGSSECFDRPLPFELLKHFD